MGNILVQLKMPLKLYKADFSPPARAVMMLLDILKVPYESVEINLRAKDHLTPEFLKKNPVHTIPVLEDNGVVLQDSHAILMYIVDKYGKDDSLYPKDVVQRALVNQKLFFDTCFTYFTLKAIARSALYYGQKSISEQQKNDVIDVYGFLEEYLSRSKFLATDHVTIADISAVAYVSSLVYLIPIDSTRFPKTIAWLKYFEEQHYAQNYNTAGSYELAENITNAFNNNAKV